MLVTTFWDAPFMQTHNNLHTHGKHSHCPCSAMRFLKSTMKWKVHWLKKPILCAMYLISLKLGNSSEEGIDHWSFLHLVVWFCESYDYRPNWIHSVLIYPSWSYGAFTLHVLCLKLWGDWSWKVAYLSLNDISPKNQWEKCFSKTVERTGCPWQCLPEQGS